jgi:GalNAc-alpha-(1->4)-GalNAc-alpha-(1->3)-diNAcBac-PP-undecaprenol alpha-1,4-N-acetyl-D-galactosaminyltransferase
LEDLGVQVAALQLKEKVQLEGERKNVQDYLRNSEVFAFTSTSEGFPNALAEAMSAGLAVIAYDCMAGPSDLIDHGINGFLIPEGNEELFRVKLLELMASEELRKSFGKAAKEKMKQFHEAAIAQSFWDFITEKIA